MPQNKHISSELKQLELDLPHRGMPEMEVPANYFAHLADEIHSRILVSALLGEEKPQNPFTLPENYFEQLESDLSGQIQSEQFLSALKAENPFSVPTAYFEQLSDEVTARIHAEAFLEAMPKNVPYHLPANYFEHLTDIVISKVSKVNKISPLRATRTFYGKMSIAASLFIILSFGFLMMSRQEPKNVETALTYVSDSEIASYMAEHAYEFDHHISYQPIDESNIDINKLENDIYNAYFEEVSDEEIDNFL